MVKSEMTPNPGPDEEFKFIFDFVKKRRPQKTLEVGCNFGRELKAIENLTQVYGVDRDPEKIEKAKSYVPSGVFKVAGGESLPFEDNSMDLVFTDGCLSHNPPEKCAEIIEEMMRVTKDRIFLIEYLGTRQSASGYSNCKANTWINDYPTIFSTRDNDVLVSRQAVVGMDLFQVMVVSKGLKVQEEELTKLINNALLPKIDALTVDVDMLTKLLTAKKPSIINRIKSLVIRGIV